jgi:hypothetical protein
MLLGSLALLYPIFEWILFWIAFLNEEKLITITVPMRKLGSFLVYRQNKA